MNIKNKIKNYLIRLVVIPLMNSFPENLDILVQKNGFIRKRVHKYTFLWDAREFCRMNGIQGDYYEFGVNRCQTFAKAMKILYPYVRYYHGFDSFKGLPDFEKEDGVSKWVPGSKGHPGWFPGAMKTTGNVGYFKNQLIRQGFDKNHFTLVEGFFKETLPNYNQSGKASVLFIDCDIVSSLKSVLEFIPNVLQDGTLIYQDDFFSYRGNPQNGQQKVFREFCLRQEDFQFSEYNTYPPFAKVFIANYVYKRG